MSSEKLRFEMKHGLSQCDGKQLDFFKRIFDHCKLRVDIDEFVDTMPEEKLENSLGILQRMLTLYYADCTNPECGIYHQVLSLEKPCPECGEKLEPSQVEDWNEVDATPNPA